MRPGAFACGGGGARRVRRRGAGARTRFHAEAFEGFLRFGLGGPFGGGAGGGCGGRVVVGRPRGGRWWCEAVQVVIYGVFGGGGGEGGEGSGWRRVVVRMAVALSFCAVRVHDECDVEERKRECRGREEGRFYIGAPCGGGGGVVVLCAIASELLHQQHSDMRV